MEEQLVTAAKEARKRAYAPYSKFAVGAAVLTDGNKLFRAGNIENASYSLSICAERAVLFKAISEGERNFLALSVIADTGEPVSPCGACRQVLAEFCAPNMRIILSNLQGDRKETTVHELLPSAFTGKDLSK